MAESEPEFDWGGGRLKDFLHRISEFLSRVFWYGDGRSGEWDD